MCSKTLIFIACTVFSVQASCLERVAVPLDYSSLSNAEALSPDQFAFFGRNVAPSSCEASYPNSCSGLESFPVNTLPRSYSGSCGPISESISYPAESCGQISAPLSYSAGSCGPISAPLSYSAGSCGPISANLPYPGSCGPISAPRAESRLIDYPAPQAPPTRVLDNSCVVTKTVVRNQLVTRHVIVPTVQRFLKKTYRFVTEKVPYSGKVNCGCENTYPKIEQAAYPQPLEVAPVEAIAPAYPQESCGGASFEVPTYRQSLEVDSYPTGLAGQYSGNCPSSC